MNVDDVIDTLKFIGDIKTAVVIATDGKKMTAIVSGKVREVATMLAIAAEKDEKLRHVIGCTSAALIIGK